MGNGGELLDAEAEIGGLRGEIVPGAAARRLHGERLDGAHAVDRLDEHGLPFGLHGVEIEKTPPEGTDEHADHDGDQAGEAQHHERQARAVEEEHRQEDEQRDEIEPREEEPAREEFADAPGLLHMLHEHARGGLFEDADREVEEMGKGLPRRPDVDAVGGEEQEIAAQEIERGLEKERCSHADREHGQRRVALMDEHLVDDELEEDRGREAEREEEEGGERHLAEELPLPGDLREEPGNAERPLGCGGRGGAGEQHRIAVPDVLQLLAAERDGLAAFGQGIGHDEAVVRRERVDHDPIAVGEAGEDGIGLAETRQLVEGEAHGARRETRFGRHADDGVGVDGLPPDRMSVSQPIGIEIDPVSPRRPRQADERGIGLRRHEELRRKRQLN